MEDASPLNIDTLSELKQLVEDYPYFQTARMLYLKNLAMLNDVQFGAELKKTAIYIQDRKMLYILIEDVRLILKKYAEEQSSGAENSFDIIEQFLKERGEDPDPTIVLPPSGSEDYVMWTIREGQDLSTEGSDAPALKYGDLIDKFLEDEEVKNQTNRWLDADDDTLYATPGSIDRLQHEGESAKSGDDSYFTETLARVYFKQKRYEKALEIIRNLRLKYPEKNIYFADQIRFLEKLIINTKK
jgi:tetratricopeptide (TPR) repeat protein